jgi:predicted DsbA family dithiol-disulfide isomerase
MKIEIWSDIVCPWCYIGKRRLEAALDDFDEEVDIVWRSFELDPNAPRRAQGPLDEALAAKYRTSPAQARSMMARMTQTAAEEGLELDFANAKGGNTFDAHRLIHFAKSNGLQAEMTERLFSAYMSEGRPISEHEELAKLASEVGLDADQAHHVLAGDAFAQAVRDDEAKARQLGVTGVPFFMIGDFMPVTGAQPADTLRSALERARAEASASPQPPTR